LPLSETYKLDTIIDVKLDRREWFLFYFYVWKSWI